MLTAGIEKRADGDEFVSEVCARGALTRTRQQQCVRQPLISTSAGELSTDEINKIETVLDNSCQFKIPARMLNRNALMGEIDKHVSHSANKSVIEDKCDLTSQEEFPTDEAKELADSLKCAIRVRRVKVPRRLMSR